VRGKIISAVNNLLPDLLNPRHSLAIIGLTPQITGGKKQSDEGATLFAVRVHLPC
jgi:hypothetical protein